MPIPNLLPNAVTFQLPSRVVSLVPSQTELLYHLGLTEHVIGITKFCVHPKAWQQTKTRIGGTKTVDIKKVKLLNPDLILANKEENVKEQVEELMKDFPVWVSDVNSLENACEMMTSIGHLTGKTTESQTLVDNIQQRFAQYLLTDSFRAAYLIWKQPFMTAGGDTFINDMMKKAGFENVFARKKRYPVVTLDDLHAADCRLVLLSSEPYPFKQKHVDELQLLLPHKKILLVDGEMFSWYGSRLLQAPDYFQRLQERLRSF